MTEIKQEPLDPDPEYSEQIPDQDEIHEVLEVKDTIDIKLEPVEQVYNVVQFDDIEKDKENNKKEEVLVVKDTLDFKLEPVINSDSEHLEQSENEEDEPEESEKVNNKKDSDEDFVMSESTNEDDESEEIEVDDIEDDVKERDIFLFDIIFAMKRMSFQTTNQNTLIF